MLQYNKIFSSFSVDDVKKAADFYRNILGLKVEERDGMTELQVGDNYRVLLYPKPNHEPATFTVLNLSVADVEKAVDDLAAQGVQFEHYGGDIETDAKGINRSHGMVIAWFKDPAGNILSVVEDRK